MVALGTLGRIKRGGYFSENWTDPEKETCGTESHLNHLSCLIKMIKMKVMREQFKSDEGFRMRKSIGAQTTQTTQIARSKRLQTIQTLVLLYLHFSFKPAKHKRRCVLTMLTYWDQRRRVLPDTNPLQLLHQPAQFRRVRNSTPLESWLFQYWKTG